MLTAMVKQFNKAYGVPIHKRPELPIQERRELRQRLLAEEFKEMDQAEDGSDLVEIADALGDMVYVILGTCVEYGIPFEELFTEIHYSNMTKLDDSGQPIVVNGKVMKGPNFRPPRIAQLLASKGMVVDDFEPVWLELDAEHTVEHFNQQKLWPEWADFTRTVGWYEEWGINMLMVYTPEVMPHVYNFKDCRWEQLRADIRIRSDSVKAGGVKEDFA